jgi:hypothetical protein
MTVAQPTHTWTSPTTRRMGYVIAIAVNAGLLFVAHNILAWDILPFLTDDWEELVPIISVSLLASMLVNLIYVAYDAPWFKSLTQIFLAAIAMAVTVRTYQVFPFDFSAYDFNWTAVTRVVLVLVMVGIVIAIIVESVKLVGAMVRASG